MRLEDAGIVAVDTECSGLFPDDGARVASVAVAWEGGSASYPFDQGVRDKLNGEQQMLEWDDGDPNLGREEWERLLEMLGGKLLVFHNAAYDLVMLQAGTRHWPGRDLTDNLWFDTMLAARTLEPNESASLDNTARRLGLEGKQGIGELKEWLRRAKLPANRYDLAPWEVVRPYVTGDVEQTWELHKLQLKGGNAKEVIREIELCKVLTRMELRGVGYNAAESRRIAKLLTERADEIEARMPFKCDISSAKRYFFLEAGMTPARTTDRGNPSLDEEAIRDWAAEGVQWAQEYKEVKWARRAVSMWYGGYTKKLGPDGRLRPRYRQGSVASGRLSVERVQLQAMPKADRIEAEVTGVRELLQAREGHELWSLDMQQAELRVAAKYAGCQSMLDALALGIDFHGRTCERVMHCKRTDKDWKLKRDIAKRLTFGSIFQIGAEKFQATLAKLANIHLPLQECDVIVRTWRNEYPEFGHAYRKAEKVFGSRGWVKILPGTEYESKSYLAEGEWAHTGWNRMVQGSLAAWLRMWLVEIEKNWPGLVVLTVHDSVVLELPTGYNEIPMEVAVAGEARASKLFGVKMPIEIEQAQTADKHGEGYIGT